MNKKNTTPDYEKLALETLESLERWSDRLENHNTPKRIYERQQFQGRMKASIPVNSKDNFTAALRGEFIVWARNVSQSGISFIYQHQLELGKLIICLNTESKGDLWYLVELVRKRQVHNGFWEYGAAIKEKMTL